MMPPTTPPTTTEPVIHLYKCQRVGCEQDADFIPRIREKGRNCEGILLSLPICREHSKVIGPRDLILPDNLVKVCRYLRSQGQYCSTYDQLEVAWLSVLSSTAQALMRQSFTGSKPTRTLGSPASPKPLN